MTTKNGLRTVRNNGDDRSGEKTELLSGIMRARKGTYSDEPRNNRRSEGGTVMTDNGSRGGEAGKGDCVLPTKGCRFGGVGAGDRPNYILTSVDPCFAQVVSVL